MLPFLLSESSLSPADRSAFSRRLFGGSLRSATVCQSCGASSSRIESFSELQLTFPTAFTPVVDIFVLTGDNAELSPPPGYERLSTNVNQGRTNAPYTYLCLRRAPSWESHDVPPITDVDIVSDALLPGADVPAGPPGYYVIPDDLNEGGQRRVFIAVRRTPNGSPFTALHVVATLPEATKPAKGPQGFVKIDHDLNLVRHDTCVCRVHHVGE